MARHHMAAQLVAHLAAAVPGSRACPRPGAERRFRQRLGRGVTANQSVPTSRRSGSSRSRRSRRRSQRRAAQAGGTGGAITSRMSRPPPIGVISRTVPSAVMIPVNINRPANSVSMSAPTGVRRLAEKRGIAASAAIPNACTPGQPSPPITEGAWNQATRSTSPARSSAAASRPRLPPAPASARPRHRLPAPPHRPPSPRRPADHARTPSAATASRRRHRRRRAQHPGGRIARGGNELAVSGCAMAVQHHPHHRPGS